MAGSYDYIIIGLGANGSSALYELSKTSKLSRKGNKILGFDRFIPPHIHGSSHGESRIIRQAYYEDPVYVPLLKEAYQLWKDLEKEAGKELFLKTGGLMLGREDSAVVTGSRLSAETHGIPYEYLSAADLHHRFPAFRPRPDTIGLLEKEAGILFPEECIRTFLEGAVANGAAVRYNEAVLKLQPFMDKVEVTTTAGTYTAEKLILTAGPWTGALLPELGLPLRIERQVVLWFRDGQTAGDAGSGKPSGKTSRFGPASMPVYIWEYTPGKMFYGFPDLGHGIKIGWHHNGSSMRPDELSPDIRREEISEMSAVAADYLGMQPVFDSGAVCMYTNTPDQHFIIDFHPAFKNIIIASPCSGHGFKFSSLTGRLLSDMAMGRPARFDLSSFSIARPALQP